MPLKFSQFTSVAAIADGDEFVGLDASNANLSTKNSRFTAANLYSYIKNKINASGGDLVGLFDPPGNNMYWGTDASGDFDYYDLPTGAEIGEPISGGTANRVLYIDNIGELADSANLKYESNSDSKLTIKGFGTSTNKNFVITNSSDTEKLSFTDRGILTLNEGGTKLTYGESNGRIIFTAQTQNDLYFSTLPASTGRLFLDSRVASDTGTNPAIVLGGLTSAAGALVTRPLLEVQTGGASGGYYFLIKANRQIGFNTPHADIASTLHVRYERDNTGGTRSMLRLDSARNTSNGAATDGSSIDFYSRDDSRNIIQQGAISCFWTDPTTASVDSAITFQTQVDSTLSEKLRIEGNEVKQTGARFTLFTQTSDPDIVIQRNNNGSAVTSGTVLGEFSARGNDGTSITSGSQSAIIQFRAAENFSGSAAGVNIRFRMPGIGTKTQFDCFEVLADRYVRSPGGIFTSTSPAATKDASAILEVEGTDGGFLLPRMTHTEAGAISSPANGLVIYVTSTDATFTSVGVWAREGGSWVKL